MANDILAAAFFLAFDVQRHVRVVEGHAQERPAFGEYEAHAFVRRLGDDDASSDGPLFKGLQYPFAVSLYVVCALNFEAVFLAFSRMLQVCNQIADSFPRFIGLGRRNEQLDRQIGAVVEVVVFAQRAVARRFNR